MADLFPYTANPEDDSVVRPQRDTHVEGGSLMRQMPSAQPHEIEKVLDTQVAKRTHTKEYLRHLVKWQNRLIEDSSWLDAAQIQEAGYFVENLMERRHDFLLSRERHAGKSR